MGTRTRPGIRLDEHVLAAPAGACCGRRCRRGAASDQLPVWIKTPDQFIDWLTSRLSAAAIRGYFTDLELIAKQTCDLEMLRFARQNKSQP